MTDGECTAPDPLGGGGALSLDTVANPLPANRAKIAPGRLGVSGGGIIPRLFPLRPACPPKTPAFDGLANAPHPPRTFLSLAARGVC